MKETPPAAAGIEIRHAHTKSELLACFPVIQQLRANLKVEADWIAHASHMKADGYRVLAAWKDGQVAAVAGYRTMENMIHGRFIYVDDLVTAAEQRGNGLGATLLAELSVIGEDELCQRLVLDTAATNTNARRFYKREGLLDAIVGFVKPLGRAG